jgi:hypothetical protein
VKKLVMRALALAIVVTLSFGASAEAAVTLVRTSVTMTASKTSIQRGQAVFFSGRLKARAKKCRARQRVTLYRNRTRVRNLRTTTRGKYTFKIRPTQTARWRVRYAGRRFGVHPNIRRCLASSSKARRVRVRR